MNEMQFNPYQMYQNPYQMNTTNFMSRSTTPSNSNNGITWVQGIEGAKAYQIPQNSNVMLMDSENDRMYIKTSDNIGMCNLRAFDLKEVTNEEPKQNSLDLSNYVTRDELSNILASLTGGKANEQSVQSTQSKSSKSTNSK